MQIRWNCPHCDEPLTAPPSKAGYQAKCRTCGCTLLVPSPDQVADRLRTSSAIESPREPTRLNPDTTISTLAGLGVALLAGVAIGLFLAVILSPNPSTTAEPQADSAALPSRPAFLAEGFDERILNHAWLGMELAAGSNRLPDDDTIAPEQYREVQNAVSAWNELNLRVLRSDLASITVFTPLRLQGVSPAPWTTTEAFRKQAAVVFLSCEVCLYELLRFSRTGDPWAIDEALLTCMANAGALSRPPKEGLDVAYGNQYWRIIWLVEALASMHQRVKNLSADEHARNHDWIALNRQMLAAYFDQAAVSSPALLPWLRGVSEKPW